MEEPRGEVHVSYDLFGRSIRHARRVDRSVADETMEYGLSGLLLKGSVDALEIEPTYDRAGRALMLGQALAGRSSWMPPAACSRSGTATG